MKAEEREILEDLLVTAHNDARRKAETAMQEKMQALDRRPRPAARTWSHLKWPQALPAPKSNA